MHSDCALVQIPQDASPQDATPSNARGLRALTPKATADSRWGVSIFPSLALDFPEGNRKSEFKKNSFAF